MSTYDQVTCPGVSNTTDVSSEEANKVANDEIREKKEKKSDRRVCFPDDHLVTQYFEPANPWLDVPSTTRVQLIAEYLEACKRHRTHPIDSVLLQLKELPENTIGGCVRAARLQLSCCSLLGTAPADALEAVLRRVQFRRLEFDHTDIDDDGAEALFDIVEYYESACALSIAGERQFGVRGWQAAARMIKNSAELTELEVCEGGVEGAHATVLARALKPVGCRLRVLCLQRAALQGEPLMCLVKVLKTNTSIRELRLCDNGLLPSDAYQIANLLKYNSRIQLLDLSNNAIQDAGLGYLAETIYEDAASSPPTSEPLDYGFESRGLAFLVLWNNYLTKDCYVYLAKIMQSPSLRVLNVGRNALGCECVRALRLGQAAHALVMLGLQAARLGPTAAAAIADLIRADTRLQRLDLRDNRLGAGGLQAILAAMRDNTTLTQIDLDDPPQDTRTGAGVCAATCTEAASVARAVADIRALCRRNEPRAHPPDRLMRKISLTCHPPHPPPTHHKTLSGEEERRGRLRSPAPSPAPSPAGSPTPHGTSRFSVTRVTPDRDSSDSSNPSTPTRPYASPSPSRFKVIQVVEPHPPPPPSPKKGSRFSVTRNYDTVYNPSPSPPSTKSDVKTVKIEAGVPTDTGTDKHKPKENKASNTEMHKERTQLGNITNIVKPKIIVRSEDDSNDESEKSIDIEETTPSDKRIETNKHVNIATKQLEELDVTNSKTKHEDDFGIEKYTDRVVVQECDIDPNIIIGFDLNPQNVKAKPANETVISARYPETDSISNNVILQSEPIIEFEVRPQITVDLTRLKDFMSDKDIKSDAKHTATVHSEKADSANVTVVDKDREDTKLSESNISDSRNSVTVPSGVINLIDVKTDAYSDKTERLSHNETVDFVDDDRRVKSEIKLVKSSVSVSETEKVETQVEVVVKSEANSLKTKEQSDQIVSNESIDRVIVRNEKGDVAMKQIEAITEDLGHLIQQMHDLSTKTRMKHATDLGVGLDINIVPGNRDNVVLKKNKSESSLDSPDLEVSRLMRKPVSAFCDSSSSLEISGSSVESLNMIESRVPKPIKEIEPRGTIFSTESSMESTSDVTPVNLNTSVSSNESVSPIIFGGTKKIHGSLSSLEASVSSLDSARQEKVMVTSADSGIEYSLQHPSEMREDSSSNEGTLTYSSSGKEPIKKEHQDTLTSPKRTSSLLDVPALKSKGLDRMRKISWVAPSASFHIPKPEEKVEIKQQTNLEKLLSLFQHPSSLFSRSGSDDEKKSTSSTPPRKDSSLTSSFWSWGAAVERVERDDKDTDSLSEATDSTLSERVQVSFVDESFSRKLDSKTPSTDTDNTLSEFQTFPNSTESVKVTDSTTDENLVQNNLALSDRSADAGSAGPTACDNIDLIEPNDLNRNVRRMASGDADADEAAAPPPPPDPDDDKSDKVVDIRPRTFAAVLKASGSQNSQEKQSADAGQPVDKLPPRVIMGIKENISPENTLTASMTAALEKELSGRPSRSRQPDDVGRDLGDPGAGPGDVEMQADRAPIARIDEMSDVAADECVQLAFIDDAHDDCRRVEEEELEQIDVARDALSYLAYEKRGAEEPQALAEELREAEIKELLDLSPELVVDEAIEIPEVFAVEMPGLRNSPVIPERAKIKRANSLEDLSKLPPLAEKSGPKTKTIAFEVPESTTPRDIPETRRKLRTRSGSSPKSLPESLNKPCPLTKMDSLKRKKKVSSLGKMARDSLLALNMSEEEIAEFRRSYKLTSVESLRSLESVSEDANSQSGTSVDSRCRACLRTSQESLMSLDSITEDCRCLDDCEKRGHR
ncbi:uncharacterized protein LOC121736434 [Aricia agestis]|uniref:uncharacterized protein LOC121736434 n=1 Tax=Aricia agestis TaxID=91739 RepID=UPI001C202ABC|nr:uncharacterized protein LOC121736434 [Aricia agestis]